MKSTLFYLLGGLLIVAMFGCEKEDAFECDRNSTVQRADNLYCAHGRMDRTSGGESITAFEMDISWANGWLKISVTSDRPLEEGTYFMDDGASFNFSELNRRDKAIITITKLDPDNRLISGTFDLEAEGNSNSTGYQYTATGSFTDVPY